MEDGLQIGAGGGKGKDLPGEFFTVERGRREGKTAGPNRSRICARAG